MSQVRVFIVEDHPIVRHGLMALLDAVEGMEVVGEASEGAAAVRQVFELRPDVVVMDVSMQGMSGTEATRQICEGCPEVQVVALTAHEDRAYLQQMMAAGARGYVLKRSAAADLVGAIRHAAAGNTYVDPVVAAKVVIGSGQSGESPETPALSEREIEVLRQLAQGYSNKQIAARLKISVKTVETYKARGMEKLGADSRVEIVKYAMERGWLRE
jgi:DNA-binding NarL/FixJ family response regulator